MEGESTKAVPESVFETDGDLFVPTRLGRGYWQPGTLSGAAMASLLGFVIERDVMEPGLIPVRFGVDMLRMAPAQPLGVDLRVLHDGGRLKLVEASLSADGKLCARATCQLARQSRQPDNPVWQSPPWPAPPPEGLEPLRRFGNWEVRPVPADTHPRFRRESQWTGQERGTPEQGNPTVLGTMGPPPARQAWLRAGVEIVAGHPLTPFGHVALTADFASPLAHSSEHGIDFVNTDFTVHLHRLPVGEWLGYELTGHLSQHGIAAGQCALHDPAGPLGTISVSAMSLSRKS
ncbi:thioesterase family protein [Novosphingobium sp. NBM11]|nr:thioesterase family protein [Novosphingobium sp. NBM11]